MGLVKRYAGRIVGNVKFKEERVSDIFVERDKLREERDYFKAKYDKSLGTIKKVRKNFDRIKKIERHYRMEMLLGGLPNLGRDVVENFGIDEKKATNSARWERNERVKLIKEMNILMNKYFGYVLKTICENENVRRAMAMVYYRGDILYATNKFEKKFGSTYMLENLLSKDVGFNVDLEKGRKCDVIYEGKRLCFVPDKKRKSQVVVAYYIPNKGDDVTKIFKKVGERAARFIHDSIRTEKTGEVAFA